jgi:hypothetical protein
MSQYAIIFQGLAALLALFFIFLTYMNTKTWRWVHVTFTFLVFAATMGFCAYAAMTLKTRAAWVKYHDEKEAQVADLSEQLERVTRGDPNNPEAPSLVGSRQELGRAIIDRGRVWRQTTPTIAGNEVTVSTTPPVPIDPNDPNAAPPPAAAGEKNHLQPKDVVHAFKEGQVPIGEAGETAIVPVFYLGEMQVTAATDTTATLAPTLPLTPQQSQAAQAPGTWALYEIMPVDSHQAFAGLKPEEIQALFPDQAMPPEVRAMVIDSYVRDGQRAQETDPPENVWVELRFTKPHTIAVDAPAVNSIDSEPFNAEGLAQLERLRRADPGQEPQEVEFGPGPTQINTGVFDQQTAETLVAQGVAEVVQPIFRRKLTDYELKFHAIHERIVELNIRLRQLNADQQAVVAATTAANNQATLLTELQTKLNDDLAKVKFELAELSKYADALAAQLSTTQSELSKLYRSNKAIGQEMAETSARLTEQVNRRVRESTALNTSP